MPTSATTRFAARFRGYARDETAASTAEYALTLLILSGCAIVMLHALGHRMDKTITTLATLMRHA